MQSVSKLVVIKLDGSISQGCRAELEIGPEGERATATCQGHLPANPVLSSALQQWQRQYRCLGQTSRISAVSIKYSGSINSARDWKKDCLHQAEALSQCFLTWLTALSFQPLEQLLREELQREQTIRIVLKTADSQLPYLPWHLWPFIERYSQAELVFSQFALESRDPLVTAVNRTTNKVRVLLILGDSQGIDADSDRQQLSQLQDADVTVLVEPQRQTLTDALWDQGWDILFFAGHSQTESKQTSNQQSKLPKDEPFAIADTPPYSPLSPSVSLPQSQGRLFINATESLTVEELRYGLKRAIAHNLQLAIFNSCDGLGLAQNLAQLNLPNLVVMREPIPDTVAQTFLKYFLRHFSGGATLNLSVRQAREQLQGLEESFPCASWLPIIYQHSEVVPPTWQQLCQHSGLDPIQVDEIGTDEIDTQRQPQEKPSPVSNAQWVWGKRLAMSLAVTAAVLGLQNLGVMRFLELRSFDTWMRLRPQLTTEDARVLVIAVTEADVQAQSAEERRGSLSDSALEQLLLILQQAQPRVVGLDIYRDFPVLPERQKLAELMGNADQFVAICKHHDPDNNILEVPPPPEVSPQAQGFSDVAIDLDNRVRRHLLALDPLPGNCLAPYALNVQLALRYLQPEGIQLEFDPSGQWRLGQARFQTLVSGQVPYATDQLTGHQILLNYRMSGNASQAFHQVSLGEVLSGQVDPSFLRDHVVLIGTTANSFKDYVQTPFPGSYGSAQIPGVVLQAQMVSQLIDGALGIRPLLWAWPRWMIISGLLSIALLGSWVGQSQMRLPRLGLLALLSLGYGGLCWGILAFAGGWTPFLPALVALWGSAAVGHLSQRQTAVTQQMIAARQQP